MAHTYRRVPIRCYPGDIDRARLGLLKYRSVFWVSGAPLFLSPIDRRFYKRLCAKTGRRQAREDIRFSFYM